MPSKLLNFGGFIKYFSFQVYQRAYTPGKQSCLACVLSFDAKNFTDTQFDILFLSAIAVFQAKISVNALSLKYRV